MNSKEQAAATPSASSRVQAEPGKQSAESAMKLIVKGVAPEGMIVREPLEIRGNRKLTTLPANLTVGALNLTECTALAELPPGLKVRRLCLDGCTSMWFLPAGLCAYEVRMRDTKLITVPDDLRVRYTLDLQGSTALKKLPPGLKVNTLNLRGCSSLEELPEGLSVRFLDISDCISLSGKWPEKMSLHTGRLVMRNCSQFTGLPSDLKVLAQLDLRGCPGITRLPENLVVTSWIDIAGTGITSLPESMSKTDIRWKGIRISRRVAFEPETITYQEVLGARNLELRRVLLERMGYEKFMDEAHAKTIHQDSDPGGERRLLKVAIQGDEDLVCLAVTCPSTGRRYMLRVPPATRTCHQAAAWIAGFDRAADYRPMKET